MLGKVVDHWEGDLIPGLEKNAIGTLVERKTRFTMLLPLPGMEGHEVPRNKPGLALAGHGADAVRRAITASTHGLPLQRRQTLPWDRGAEISQQMRLRADTGLRIYFCESRSPWQRGTNENTNGLLRQYFPKGTGFSRYGINELQAVATALNNRPHKVLGWKTPAEALKISLSSSSKTSVATTG